jgi:electron transport complex protein RnfC
LLNEKGVICSVTGQPLSDILMQNQNADTLVINALGQDIFPYREDLLLEQNMLKIIEATAILNKILNFSSIIIAVHNEKAFSADEQKMIEELRIPLELVLFPKKYPQAFPKMISQSLQKAYSKRNMKKILILETRTMIAVYDSVVKNKPYIEQYVYVGGNSLKDSAILKAKIGTPIGSLIAELGGFITKPDVIAINSVMHGPYTLDLDTPVTKNMHAIHALSGHDWRKQRTDICTSCGNCVDYCPENCNPMLMYKFIKYNQPAEKLKTYFDSCIECGVCTYVCPNYVNLQNYFINARKQHHVE